MSSLAPHRLGIGRAILTGWLTVGTVDILDAILMTLWRGGSPTRMLQGIASGMLGPPSFEGGTPTAVLGLGIHFFIAFAVVTTYLVASQRFELLTRKWVVCGILYGLGVWAFMNFVVIPLSQIHRFPTFTPVGTTNQLLIHALGVGLLTAWFARWTRES
jgi:hypothetical protein